MRTKILALLTVLCLSPLIAHADEADAKLKGLHNADATGTVHFTDQPGGVKVHYQLSGLNKNETYAVLVRAQGDCLPRDNSSVTSHPTEKNLYTGDLPYIQSDDLGKIDKTIFIKDANVNSEGDLSTVGKNPLTYKSLVLAERTSPVTGNSRINAGSPLACGVVTPD